MRIPEAGKSEGPSRPGSFALVGAELGSALRLLTVLPIAPREGCTPTMGRMFFPAVGLALGGLAWGCFWVGSVTIGATAAAFFAVAALAVLSGGLHLDGLGDAADGLLGGSTVARRLEIMRDPRIGSFGSVAIVLVLIGDFALLSNRTHAGALAALLGAPALARLAMLGVIVALPYVRSGGLGAAVAGTRRARDLGIGTAVALTPLALDWRHGLIALGLAALVGVGAGTFARRRIGGATGDIYGAVLELSQLAALAGYAIRL
jgi:adenosylcobinamide-GDP ribazoletransferase